jgi:hypothetical protein
MKGKSGGLSKKLGCQQVHAKNNDCLQGRRIIILCRKPSEWKTSKQYRTGSHRIFECVATNNAHAKLEAGLVNLRK